MSSRCLHIRRAKLARRFLLYVSNVNELATIKKCFLMMLITCSFKCPIYNGHNNFVFDKNRQGQDKGQYSKRQKVLWTPKRTTS